MAAAKAAFVRKEKNMSTTAETPETEIKTDDERKATAATVVATEVGSSPAAAKTDAAKAMKWYRVVEIPEANFSGFCRLPNDYQHKDIREKAMAAKGRRVRQMKNPATDAYDALEGELDAIASLEGAVEFLVEELLQANHDRDLLEARKDVEEGEDEDSEFAKIRQDQERFREMMTMTVEERPEDEWNELVGHLDAWSTKIQARMAEIQQPRREALTALGLDGLLDKVRQARIETESQRAFMDTYTFWQMLVGTLKLPEGFDHEDPMAVQPRQRYFDSEDDLRNADPMVVSTLADVFDALEGGLGSLTVGNS